MAYSTTTGISGLIERVTVGPRAVAWVGGHNEEKKREERRKEEKREEKRRKERRKERREEGREGRGELDGE